MNFEFNLSMEELEKRTNKEYLATKKFNSGITGICRT